MSGAAFHVIVALPMTPRRRIEPSQAFRLVTQALGGRIPLSTLRDRLAGLSEKVAIHVSPAASPGLRVRGQAHALGASISFSARIEADGMDVAGEQRTVRIHVSEVVLSTDDEAPGPLAEAIRNRAIDTENPATLIGNMMSLPDMIVEAEGQDVVIDLMKVPAIHRDEYLHAAFAVATSYLGVTGIRVVNDAIEPRLGLLPAGADRYSM